MYIIRQMEVGEYGCLDDFLYEAVFVPQGKTPPPRSITKTDELQKYVKDFGKGDYDVAFAAVDGLKIIGAVWSTVANGYGNIDGTTPELAIAVKRDYRGKGIGESLLLAILNALRARGCRQASLSVQKANYAVNLYLKLGFIAVDERDDELIMIKKL